MSSTLRHSAGEVVWERLVKIFQAHQAHELVHLRAFLVQDTAGHETRLDIASDR